MFLKLIETPVIPTLPSPDFPALPSWKYYYLSKNGEPTSLPNQGSPQDLQMSILTWYAMKSPKNLIWTPYAQQGSKDWEDCQIEDLVCDQPDDGWDLPASMKLRLRQDLTMVSIIAPYSILPLLYASNKSITDYTYDIYLFPMHPDANFRLATELTIDRKQDLIDEYFRSRGIAHLVGHDIEYYPIYYLFFLLTRFASYPFNAGQIALIQIRKTGSVEQRQLVDSIIDSEITPEVIQLVLNPVLPGALPGWTRLGKDYLHFLHPVVPQGVDYTDPDKEKVIKILSDWTDQQIVELCREKSLEISDLSQFESRNAWIIDVLNTLNRFRST